MPRRLLLAAALAAAATSCASLSARSRIETGLIDLGMGASRARCIAGELAEDLTRRELNAVADFVDGLAREETPGGALDAILRIDDPRAAAAVGAAALSCALTR